MKIWREKTTRRALVWVALPVIAYTLAALVMTWPLPAHLNSDAAGVGHGDTYMMIRGAWAAREALLDGRNPLDQTLLAYPHGITSRLMWSTPLRWVPVMLLSFVVSPLMAFNLWLIATLVLNGLAAYWLGMELSGRLAPAALLGGLVFTAFPTMQGHLSVGHIDVLAMYGLPLFALCLWRVLTGAGTWRTAAWGGVWLALASLGLTSQVIYNVMPVALFLGLYFLLARRGDLIRRGAAWRDQPWIKALALGAFGGAILLIFFGPLLTSAGQAEIGGLREAGRVRFSADLLAFVSPSPFGPFDDLGLVPSYARDVLATNATEGAAYLGIVALVLAVTGVAARREARPWLVVALGAMLLSLGPLLKWRDDPVVLRIEAAHSYVTLPWAAFEDLPVLDMTRTPGRFNGATALAWGALVSIGAGVLLRRVRRRDSRFALAAILGVIILFEYQLFWPYETGSAAQPDYFRQLARQDDVRAVLNVPVLNSVSQMLGMAEQMVHGKPMIAGQLYRHSPQDPAVLNVLNSAAWNDPALTLTAWRDEDARYVLSVAGADRLIFHKQLVPDPGQIENRLRVVLGAPEYDDALIAVFVVPRVDRAPPGFQMPVVRNVDGWRGPVDVPYGAGFEAFFLGEAGDWHLFTAAPDYGELVFEVGTYGMPRRVGVWLDDHLITARVIDQGTVRLPLWLDAGFHTLRFEALGGCDVYPFTLTCLAGDCAPADPPACLSVAFGRPIWQASDRAPHAIDAPFDHGLRLRAYDVRLLPDGQIDLRLFWQADHALPGSYALFVHVADPATSQPQAQADVYPLILTDEWPSGARWVSEVQIDGRDLPPGDYALNVGWFDPVTGARLGVRADRPWADAGILHLETLTLGG